MAARRAVLAGLTAVATLVVGEGILQVLAASSLRVRRALDAGESRLPDARLEYRPGPGWGDHDLAFVDALAELQESLRRGRNPYFESPDGHPNRLGHEAVSRLVAEALKRQGLPERAAPAAPGS